MTQRIAAFPKEIALRDCSRVLVRSPEDGDEQGLLDFFLRIPEEERFFLKEDVTAPGVVHRWVTERDFRRALALLALDGPRIVADAVLIRRRGNSRSHIGEIRVVVAPEYRDHGLGTALIRELCDVADDAGLEKVMFELVADREQEAIRAAEWLGFLRVATIEGGAVDPLGHHHDVVLMAMPLGRWYHWTKF
ncbi:MAG TPA: GNAT family N-acetyltransferase [Dehalococcoidia bacterium]|nr:GNAT family N-acetyltransferase [Dehalococcoidia bacterium]